MKNVPNNLSIAKTVLVLIGLAGLWFSGTGVRADTIRVNQGRTPSGDVTKITADAVTVTSQGGSEIQVPTNRITLINFKNDPPLLARARNEAFSERFEAALETMKQVDAKGFIGPLAADAAFIPAMAEAQLALRGKMRLDEACKKMLQFIKDYPDSYHYYQAVRLAGDLLAAEGEFDAVVRLYEKLDKAPWPEYQADAKIHAALACAEKDQPAMARKLLEQAAKAGKLDATQTSRLELAKALCLIKEDKSQEAIRAIESQIKSLPPQDNELNAQAYNLLGRAYSQASQPQDAVLAFLHVDLMYPTNALAHAEALSNLASLWNQIHKPQRARKASETLKQRYPFSRWSK